MASSATQVEQKLNPSQTTLSSPKEIASDVPKRAPEEPSVRKYAQMLYDNTILQGIWGALDAWIISYSTFKLFFDVISPPGASSSDGMHDFLTTKEGMVAASIDMFAVVTLSVLGNTIDAEEKGYTLCEMLPGTILDNKTKQLFRPLASGKQELVKLEKGKLYLEIVDGKLRYTVLKGNKICQALITVAELKQAHQERIAKEGLQSHQVVPCIIQAPLTIAEFNPLLAEILSITHKNGHAKDQSKTIKNLLAWFWPYFRDVFKGVKFAYRGIRSTFLMAKMLGIDDLLSRTVGVTNILNLLVIPGLFFGAVAAVSRVYNRNLVTFRKEQKKINNSLLVEAQDIEGYDLVKMTDGPYEKRKIYVVFEKDVLNYAVINAKGEVCKGSIPLAALKYAIVKDEHGNELEPPIEFFQEYYFPHILNHLAEKNHVTINNTKENCKKIRAKMTPQSETSKRWGMVSAGYSGFIDGLYTYMGVVGLVAAGSVSFPILIALTTACSLFTMACMISRCYEEYDYQKDLIQTQLNVEITLLAKELESLFFQVQKFAEQEADNDISDDDTKKTADNSEIKTKLLKEISETKNKLLNEIDAKLKAFEIASRDRQAIVAGSYTIAALAGLRSGLYAFSAISSIMFATASFCAIALIAIPPAVVFTGVILGLLSLAGFVLQGCYQHYQHLKAQEPKLKTQPENIEKSKVITQLNAYSLSIKAAKPVKPTEVKNAIIDAMVMDHSVQTEFQGWFEMVRMIASGAGNKGIKSIEYPLNSLQEPDGQGHYKDTPGMLHLGYVASVLYGVIYGLRGFGKNLKGGNERTPLTVKKLDSQEEMADKSKVDCKTSTEKAMNQKKIGPTGSSDKSDWKRVILTREEQKEKLMKFSQFASMLQSPPKTPVQSPITQLPPKVPSALDLFPSDKPNVSAATQKAEASEKQPLPKAIKHAASLPRLEHPVTPKCQSSMTIFPSTPVADTPKANKGQTVPAPKAPELSSSSWFSRIKFFDPTPRITGPTPPPSPQRF